MANYARLIRRPVPQREALDARQVQNNAGGYVYAIDDWARLARFLILGSDANTYYQKAEKLTRENAQVVQRCYDADPEQTVNTIVAISAAGRAPKNDAAIFALALGAAHVDLKRRRLALAALPKVCRTATHLFQFVTVSKALGKGFGRAFKRAVANWYDQSPVDRIAYQAIKYREREGYSHKRLLQLSHPKGDETGVTEIKWKPKDGEEQHREVGAGLHVNTQRDTLYRYIVGKDHDDGKLPAIVKAHQAAMVPLVPKKNLVDLITEFRLPWEALPTEVHKDPDVWKAMLPFMGMTALIRNLGRMTAYEVFKPLSKETATVVARLTDREQLRKARVHPFNVLQALAVYRSGQAVRGKMSWQPLPQILDALDKAFYLAFETVVPTGKRQLIGLDVSGSMSSPLMGSALTVAEGAAAMAMTTMRTEKNWHVMAFDDGIRDLKLTPSMSLEEVLERTMNINGGGTDCALPMQYAQQQGWEVDAFEILTDNETWAGDEHPMVALGNYRKKSGLQALLVTVGMTSTGFSIADPDDGGAMDVVGFDSAAPSVIADFIRGGSAATVSADDADDDA